MSVLVLMYHRTPVAFGEAPYDVPLSRFRSQIEMLMDAGVSFIRFNEVGDPARLASGRHVAITFDDGHESNGGAFEYLAENGIKPAAFIVRDWARARPGYLSPRTLRELAGICDFGGHGTTHTDLRSLSNKDLANELQGARAFIEDVTGQPIDIMALPGGKGDRRVVHAAQVAGYRLIANSVPLPNARHADTINRICVVTTDGCAKPKAYVKAGAAFWAMKSLKVFSRPMLKLILRR